MTLKFTIKSATSPERADGFSILLGFQFVFIKHSVRVDRGVFVCLIRAGLDMIRSCLLDMISVGCASYVPIAPCSPRRRNSHTFYADALPTLTRCLARKPKTIVLNGEALQHFQRTTTHARLRTSQNRSPSTTALLATPKLVICSVPM